MRARLRICATNPISLKKRLHRPPRGGYRRPQRQSSLLAKPEIRTLRIKSLAVGFALLVCVGAAPLDAESPAVGVTPQYGTTHVYVAPDQVDRFAQKFLATFGGASTKQGVATVTPTRHRGRRSERRRSRRSCRTIPRSDRARRGRAMAGRRRHAAVLAHEGTVICGVPDGFRECDTCHRRASANLSGSSSGSRTVGSYPTTRPRLASRSVNRLRQQVVDVADSL